MIYFIGFLFYLGWLFSLPFRWPVIMLELLLGWLIAAVGYLLIDRQWPAIERQSNTVRRFWFAVICLIGVMLALFNILR